MRITTWDPHPIRSIRYLNAGRSGKPETARLDITVARASDFPGGLRALVLTADLQGREIVRNPRPMSEPPLLGATLAEELLRLGESGFLPPAEDVGVVLAGDLWADPQSRKRGGLGETGPVWDAFARSFRFVAGVLGNHDTLSRTRYGNQHLFDGTWVKLTGLRLGGVSGIIGPCGKPGRKDADTFLLQLHAVLEQRPTLVILHMGPDAPASGLIGSDTVRETLEDYPATLVVCGHCHAEEALHLLSTGTQVVNVDARVVIVVPEDAEIGRWA